MLFAFAFVIAIGSAVAPKAATIVSNSSDVTALDLSTCEEITCPNSGTIHCGYAINKCNEDVFVNRPTN